MKAQHLPWMLVVPVYNLEVRLRGGLQVDHVRFVSLQQLGRTLRAYTVAPKLIAIDPNPFTERALTFGILRRKTLNPKSLTREFALIRDAIDLLDIERLEASEHWAW